MGLVISRWVHINNRIIIRNGASISVGSWPLSPEDLYKRLEYGYARFFKMDGLCKWAWLGAELLLNTDNESLNEYVDKIRIGVVLTTSSGCLDSDKKYQDSLASIASPALFVYTLPNIMLGELCIRHGIKGEQFSLTTNLFDSVELEFIVADLLEKREMEACLCGWVDIKGDNIDVCLFWVTKKGKGISFNAYNLALIYKTGGDSTS